MINLRFPFSKPLSNAKASSNNKSESVDKFETSYYFDHRFVPVFFKGSNKDTFQKQS